MERKIRYGTITIDKTTLIATAPVRRSFLATLLQQKPKRIDIVPHNKNDNSDEPSLMDIQLIRMQPTASRSYPVIEKVVTVKASSLQEAAELGVIEFHKRKVDKKKSV